MRSASQDYWWDLMTNCLLCGGEHPLKQCPLTADTKTYLEHFAPKVTREEHKRSSLAPNQFESLFGVGAEELLQDVLEGEEWSPEQRELAIHILGGDKTIHGLTGEERSVIDGIAQQLASSRPGRRGPPAIIPAPVRPAYVATQAEMEGWHKK